MDFWTVTAVLVPVVIIAILLMGRLRNHVEGGWTLIADSYRVLGWAAFVAGLLGIVLTVLMVIADAVSPKIVLVVVEAWVMWRVAKRQYRLWSPDRS